jgi:hypothetical protein
MTDFLTFITSSVQKFIITITLDRLLTVLLSLIFWLTDDLGTILVSFYTYTDGLGTSLYPEAIRLTK